MPLSDDLAAHDDIQRARNDSLADEVGRLRRVITDQQGRIDALERTIDYSGRALTIPKWLTRRTPKGDKTATLSWTSVAGATS